MNQETARQYTEHLNANHLWIPGIAFFLLLLLWGIGKIRQLVRIQWAIMSLLAEIGKRLPEPPETTGSKANRAIIEAIIKKAE